MQGNLMKLNPAHDLQGSLGCEPHVRYAWGIFRGEPHPFRVTREHKHNPLQTFAYLGVTVLINPLI